MNKLTKISTKMWMFLISVLIISGAFVVFLFNYKIESTIKVTLMPSLSENTIFVSDVDAFKLKIGDRISLKIMNKYYDVTINKIKLDDETKKFALDLNERLPFMGENLQIPATAIYDEETIASLLFKHI